MLYNSYSESCITNPLAVPTRTASIHHYGVTSFKRWSSSWTFSLHNYVITFSVPHSIVQSQRRQVIRLMLTVPNSKNMEETDAHCHQHIRNEFDAYFKQQNPKPAEWQPYRQYESVTLTHSHNLNRHLLYKQYIGTCTQSANSISFLSLPSHIRSIQQPPLHIDTS